MQSQHRNVCKPYSKETMPIIVIVTNCLLVFVAFKLFCPTISFISTATKLCHLVILNIGKNEAQTLNFTYM